MGIGDHAFVPHSLTKLLFIAFPLLDGGKSQMDAAFLLHPFAVELRLPLMLVVRAFGMDAFKHLPSRHRPHLLLSPAASLDNRCAVPTKFPDAPDFQISISIPPFAVAVPASGRFFRSGSSHCLSYSDLD